MEILIVISLFILLSFLAYDLAKNGKQTNTSCRQTKNNHDAEEKKEDFKWNIITTWFKEQKERSLLIKDFNEKAQDTFVRGETPIVLKASSSRGFSKYHHELSARINTGFRIQAFTGRALTKKETMDIGQAILLNTKLIRQLIVLGWDTLEIHDNCGRYGCRWCLTEYADIGKIIETTSTPKTKSIKHRIISNPSIDLTDIEKYAITKLVAFVLGASPISAFSKEANEAASAIFSSLGISRVEIEKVLQETMCSNPDKEVESILSPLTGITDNNYLNTLYDTCLQIANISENKEVAELVMYIFEKLK